MNLFLHPHPPTRYSRSERQLLLYSAKALAGGPLAVLGLDVAPSTLLPNYDPDTSLVLLTGKVSRGAQVRGRGQMRGDWVKTTLADHLTLPSVTPSRVTPECFCTSCSLRPLSSWSVAASLRLTPTR